MSKNINTTEMLDIEDNFSFSTGAKRLADETRIPVMITSVTLVGNESFKDAKTGKETINYKIGVGFTSNTAHVSEEGEPVEGFHEFYTKFTATLNSRGGLFLSGLPEACNIKTAADLKQLVNGLIGKQVTALTKYRNYTNKKGEAKVAVDLEKFKALATPEDFTEVIKVIHVPYFVEKYSRDKKIITFYNGKASIDVVKNLVKPEVVEGTVDIDEII